MIKILSTKKYRELKYDSFIYKMALEATVIDYRKIPYSRLLKMRNRKIEQLKDIDKAIISISSTKLRRTDSVGNYPEKKQ